MFNNQHLFQHIDRQPNVIFVVTEQDGKQVQIFNKLCTADVYVVGSVLMLEAKMYATAESVEPQKVATFINPRGWEQVAQADPSNI